MDIGHVYNAISNRSTLLWYEAVTDWETCGCIAAWTSYIHGDYRPIHMTDIVPVNLIGRRTYYGKKITLVHSE
jgi:hypothetical protein